jgi:hypothetical protein
LGECGQMGRDFAKIVVRVAGWHTDDLVSILSRDGLSTFGCIPERLEYALV